jgi:hypothetical protein
MRARWKRGREKVGEGEVGYLEIQSGVISAVHVECSDFHKHSFYVGIWNSNSSVHMCIFMITGYFTVVLSLPISLVQLKGEGHLTTCHDGTEWEGGRAETSVYPYTSLAQKGGMWSTPRPVHFTPGRDPVLNVQEVALVSTEYLAYTRVRTTQPAASNCSDCALPSAPLYNCHVYSYSHIA